MTTLLQRAFRSGLAIAALISLALTSRGEAAQFANCNNVYPPGGTRCQVLPPSTYRGVKRAAIAAPISATYDMSNFTATMETREPDVGGAMTRSIWLHLKATAAATIVVHTFGSRTLGFPAQPLNTVLAIYTGNKLAAFKRIASNDNFKAPGIGTTQSLVQFNAKAGTEYHIQMGARSDAEGEIFATIVELPPGGGLSAFLAKTSAFEPFNDRDFNCILTVNTSLSCPDPTFVVHNSSNRTLKVTPDTDLGPGVTSPAPFSLAPKSLKVVTFAFDEAFDRTVSRSVSGNFSFSGKAGGKVVTRAEAPALVVIESSAVPPPTVEFVTPTVNTALANVPQRFHLQLTNEGGATVKGCHVRSKAGDRMRTAFQRINPKSKAAIGAPNAAFNIAPGKSVDVEFVLRSQIERRADPRFSSPAEIACANTTSNAGGGLATTFDFMSTYYYVKPPLLLGTVTKPANGVLTVAGTATFEVLAVNKGMAEEIRVSPLYAHPFDETDPSELYTAKICRTNASGNCIGSFSDSVTYQAAKNGKATFAIRVKAPSGDPGFDPAQRRMFVDFQVSDPLSEISGALVGSTSVAVHKP